MSPKIKLLAEQSGLYHRLAKGSLYPTAMTAEECDFAYGKFAELIISECTLEIYNHPTLYQDPNYKFETLLSDTKQHFGVE